MPALRKLVKETPQIIEAYRNGSNIRDIASLYHVSAGTIRNILVRNGEPLRKRGRRPKPVPIAFPEGSGFKAANDPTLPEEDPIQEAMKE